MRFLAAAGFLIGATAVQACPSWQNDGATDNMSGRALTKGAVYGVRAGGDQRLAGCRHIRFGSDSGDGYVTRDPDFTFRISELEGYKMALSVYSECDSVLVINTGNDNWYYDDDDNSDSYLDARIILTRPKSGAFDVWVGTVDGQVCDAQLAVQTFR